MGTIVTVANSKGGPGKTTVSVNLAVAASRDGLRVLVCDADPQHSSMDWRGLRDGDDIAAISLCTPTINKDLPGIAANYDLTLIDCGGRDSKVYRAAILCADICFIPCLASQVDLFAAADVVEVVKSARDFKPSLRAFWVLNQIVPGGRLSTEIKSALAEFADDVTLCESQLCTRMAYRTAYGNGCGVQELKGKEKDLKAIAEVDALYAELKKIIGGL